MFRSIQKTTALLFVLLAATLQPALGQSSNGIQFHQIVDAQRGMVQAVFPLPASWEIHGDQGQVLASGPDGIVLYESDVNQFFWSNDPMWRETVWQQGKQVLAPLPMNQVLQQMVAPSAQSQGNRLLKQYPIPGVQGFWQRFVAGMPQTVRQRQVNALGTEWTDGRGQHTFVAIVQIVSADQQSLVWQLSTQSLSAPEAQFDQALADYLYAIGNGQINPQWQAAANNQHIQERRRNDAFWADASARSRAAHEQRLAAINAAGRSARTVGDTYSEILDISHAGYLERDSIQSAGHSAGVNQISGHAIIGNHETGEHYRVEDGHRHYWVNADGRYIATDNPLFDPRSNHEIRHENWTRFVKE